MASSISAPTNINTTIGTGFNYLAAGSSIINSINSIFGGELVRPGPQNTSAIGRIRSELTKTDIMSTNMFYVTFAGLKSNVSQTLSLLCQQTSLPGVSFGTSEVRRYGYGITEKKPTFPIFTDMSMSFIGDGRGVVHKMFYNWMNTVVRFDSPTAAAWGPDAVASTVKSKALPYEVGYKKDYETTITITAIDRANRDIIVVDLLEAYPVALGDISMSWNDNDSLMSIPVTFTYYNWKYQRLSVDEILSGTPSTGLLGNLMRIGSAVQTLATISRPQSVGDVVNITNNSTMVINNLKGLF